MTVEAVVRDPDFVLYCGDALDALREMPDESVHCIVTSPPYWGLRDYGTGEWEGGDAGCDHARPTTNMNVGFNERWGQGAGARKQETKSAGRYGGECPRCGARRIDRQLGLEATPGEYVERTVEVFREARRVLRSDGTLWLNIGDSYSSGGRDWYDGGDRVNGDGRGHRSRPDTPPGLKAKDLVGIPWMLAFALRADGWWLRSEVIWDKPDAMPESVDDRPTKAHEQVFLLAKSGDSLYWTHDFDPSVSGSRSRPRAEFWWVPPAGVAGEPSRVEVEGWKRRSAWRGHDYFYDGDAIAEPTAPPTGGRQIAALRGDGERHRGSGLKDYHDNKRTEAFHSYQPATRNARTVWTITTGRYPDAHFAVMADELARRPILAGTSEAGVCPTCGAPLERIVEKGEPELGATTWSPTGARQYDDDAGEYVLTLDGDASTLKHVVPRRTVGWRPTCSCPEEPPVPAVVLDPFAGAGTTAHVARAHGRHSIGVELSPDYCGLIAERLSQLSLLVGG